MLHTSYYTHFITSYNDDVLNYHIDGRKPADFKDFRFNDGIQYQDIGNSPLMRISACAVLRLHMWCLKPEEKSYPKAFGKYLAHVVVRPFAALHDVVLDIALTVVKVAAVSFIIIGKIANKIVNPWKNVQFKDAAFYSFYNLYCQLDATINSVFFATYQLFTLGTLNLLGAKRDPYFRMGEGFNWSYWVNAKELLLDHGRVNYLKNNCGWDVVDKIALMELCKPWSFPSTRIQYEDVDFTRHFTRRWTQVHYR